MISTYIEIFIETQRSYPGDKWQAHNLCAIVYNGTEQEHDLFPYADKRFLSGKDFANNDTIIYYWALNDDNTPAVQMKVDHLLMNNNDWYGDKIVYTRVYSGILSTETLANNIGEKIAVSCKKFIYEHLSKIRSSTSNDDSIKALLDPIQKSITIPADLKLNEKVTYALYKSGDYPDAVYKPCIIHTKNEKNRDDISEYTNIRFPISTAVRSLFKELKIFYPDSYNIKSYISYTDDDDLIIPIYTISGFLSIDTKIYEYIDKFQNSFKDIINENLRNLQTEYKINIDNEVIKAFDMTVVKKSTETTKTNLTMAETKNIQKKSMMQRMIDKMVDKMAPTIDQSVQVTMDGQIAVPVGEDEFITITEDNQLVSLISEAVLPLPVMVIPTKQENVQVGDTIVIDSNYYKVLGNTSKGMKCLSYKGTSSTKHTVIEPLVGGAVVKVIKTILNSNSNMNNTGIFGNMQNMMSMVFLTEMMNGKGEGSGNMMEKMAPLCMMSMMPQLMPASQQPTTDTAMIQAITQTLAGVAQALSGITATLDKIDRKIDNTKSLIDYPLIPSNPTCNSTKADPQPAGSQITY